MRSTCRSPVPQQPPTPFRRGKRYDSGIPVRLPLGARRSRAARAALAAACLLALACDAAVEERGARADPRAEAIHRHAIVVDGHNDVATWILDSGFDLGMDGADPGKQSIEPWLC